MSCYVKGEAVEAVPSAIKAEQQVVCMTSLYAFLRKIADDTFTCFQI